LRQYLVHGLVTRRRCHCDKRVDAEHAFYNYANNGLREADVAVIPIIDDSQIGSVVTNGASGERHEQWFIKQPDADEGEPKNATDPIRIRRDRDKQSRDEQ
jgi:hypothetical protein